MENNNNKRILPIIPMLVIIILLVLILGVIFFVPKIGNQAVEEISGGNVSAAMQNVAYKDGENGRVKIYNNLSERICFSSCYPYYFEVKRGDKFESYPYLECEGADVSFECVYPGNSKVFEFPLTMSESGKHRLAIPYCSNCEEGNEFKKDNWVYSDEFDFVK